MMELYHGLPKEKVNLIEARLEHLALHPTEHNLGILEDRLLEAIPLVQDKDKMFLWKTYYTAIKLYMHYGIK
jgi:hypothetical protein